MLPQKGLENLGIDPSTSCMLSRRSTIWANSPLWWFVGCKFTSDQHTMCSQNFLLSWSYKIVALIKFWKLVFGTYTYALRYNTMTDEYWLMMGLCVACLCCMWGQHIYKEIQTTVVWEKFNAKKFSSLVWHDENWTHEIFLTMNKK